jgi:hypothetical protein
VAIMMILEWEGVSPEQYARVNETMGIASDADAPDGLISHVAAIDEHGEMAIVDLWESEQALGSFVENRLGPALAEAGIPQSQPRIHPVHNQMHSPVEGNVLILIEVDDTSTTIAWQPRCRSTQETPPTTHGRCTRLPPTAPASLLPTCGLPRRRLVSSPSSGSRRAPRSTAWARCDRGR